MSKYQLQWADGIEASKEVEPRIETDKDGMHTYTFETGSQDDAEAVARTFMMINPQHNFNNRRIVVLQDEEEK